MSFSNDVKTELAKVMPKDNHCLVSELAGIISSGTVRIGGDEIRELTIVTDDFYVAKKVFTILRKSFNIKSGVSVMRSAGNRTRYHITLTGDKTISEVSKRLKPGSKNCCAVSFARGIFLMSGSVSDPSKGSYHLEFTPGSDSLASELCKKLSFLELDLKTTKRGDNTTVYLKDSEKISDLLAAMGAGISVLNFENAKILNETRGMINRRVNCEIGNLKKSTAAASRQIECIEKIRASRGLGSLPDNLKEMAQLRIDNPEASLQELGEMFDPPLGRSGVNHRLQKLISIADNIV